MALPPSEGSPIVTAQQKGSSWYCQFILGVEEVATTYRAPTCPYGPQRFGPGRPDDVCDTLHFWSRHPGGANFPTGDGLFRFVGYAGDAVLRALATRAGG